MVSAALILVLALPALAWASGSPGEEPHCGQEYQAALQEVLRLKEECGLAAFYDCCQAITTSRAVFHSPNCSSGIYEISSICENEPMPFAHVTAPPQKMYAVCDMDTEGGGWMVIQRRINGSIDFFRNWTQYEEGFGNLYTEFWYGLRNIHCLTTRYDVELRIDLQEANGNGVTWKYQRFSVDGAEDAYRLHIGEGQGTGWDALAPHNGQQFTTVDRDNDKNAENCAQKYKGGWWYDSCYLQGSNLNGPINQPHERERTWDFLGWYQGGSVGAQGYVYYPDSVMMIRPKTCITPADIPPQCTPPTYSDPKQAFV